MKCWSCERDITGRGVWLGETYDGVEEKWPFCETCAVLPWPLYEVGRFIVLTPFAPIPDLNLPTVYDVKPQ